MGLLRTRGILRAAGSPRQVAGAFPVGSFRASEEARPREQGPCALPPAVLCRSSVLSWDGGVGIFQDFKDGYKAFI